MIEIGKLFNIEKGSLQSSKCTPGQYSFITAGEEWKTHIEYTHDCEALVFAMAASGSLGRTHYVNGKFIASDLCFILTPKKEYVSKVNLRFYSFYFNTYRERIVKATATGTSKLAINRKSFSNYQIYLVDIEKQTQLLHKLDKMKSISDGLLQTIQQQQKYAEMLRQSILQQAVEGKLCEQDPNDEPASVLLEKIKAEKERLIAEKKIKKQKPLPPISEEEKPFVLPEGWEWCRLGEIFNTVSGTTPSRNNPEYYDSPQYHWVKTTDLNNSVVRTCEELVSKIAIEKCKLHILPVDTVCVAMYGGAGTIGKTGILGIESSINQSVAAVLPLKLYNMRFLHIYLKSSRRRWMEFAAGSRKDPNINREIVKKFCIPVPPLEEQNRIVRKVDVVMEQCDKLEEEFLKANQYASQLMEAILKESFGVQETAKPAQVIKCYVDQTTPETELLAAARGKIREDTWEHLRKRALEIAGEES